MERYHGYDSDDIPGDVPAMPDEMVDAQIDERQQRELDDAPGKINAAIERLIQLGAW